jgi:hypothetical protein
MSCWRSSTGFASAEFPRLEEESASAFRPGSSAPRSSRPWSKAGFTAVAFDRGCRRNPPIAAAVAPLKDCAATLLRALCTIGVPATVRDSRRFDICPTLLSSRPKQTCGPDTGHNRNEHQHRNEYNCHCEPFPYGRGQIWNADAEKQRSQYKKNHVRATEESLEHEVGLQRLTPSK